MCILETVSSMRMNRSFNTYSLPLPDFLTLTINSTNLEKNWKSLTPKKPTPKMGIKVLVPTVLELASNDNVIFPKEIHQIV